MEVDLEVGSGSTRYVPQARSQILDVDGPRALDELLRRTAHVADASSEVAGSRHAGQTAATVTLEHWIVEAMSDMIRRQCAYFCAQLNPELTHDESAAVVPTLPPNWTDSVVECAAQERTARTAHQVAFLEVSAVVRNLSSDDARTLAQALLRNSIERTDLQRDMDGAAIVYVVAIIQGGASKCAARFAADACQMLASHEEAHNGFRKDGMSYRDTALRMTTSDLERERIRDIVDIEVATATEQARAEAHRVIVERALVCTRQWLATIEHGTRLSDGQRATQRLRMSILLGQTERLERNLLLLDFAVLTQIRRFGEVAADLLRAEHALAERQQVEIALSTLSAAAVGRREK